MVENSARIKHYRLYKKIRSAFEILHENGRLSEEEKALWLAKCDELYAEWRAKLREARKPFLKRPGRPRTEIPRNTVYPTCKRPGCEKPSAPEQVYCSRDCAPYSDYGRTWVLSEKKAKRA
jgi:hypothetical protein